MKHMDMQKANPREDCIFGIRRRIDHYLFPSDILYLKAAAQYSIVHTKSDRFKTWGCWLILRKKCRRHSDVFIRVIL